MHALLSGLAGITGLEVSPLVLISNIEAVWSLPLDLQQQAVSVWGSSFKMIYYVGITSASIAWLSSLFIKHYPLVRSQMRSLN